MKEVGLHYKSKKKKKTPQTTCDKIDRRSQFLAQINTLTLAYFEKQC